MPELPEVETWRRLAENTLLNQKIRAVFALEDPIVFEKIPASCFSEAYTGRIVTSVNRHGKHLWFTFDTPPGLYVHFAMSGSFQVYEKEDDRPRFLKLELLAENGKRLGYTNIRRFGRVRIQDDPAKELPVVALGPDPLTHSLPAAYFRRGLAGRKAPIKALLLDQKLFAGVGNWIADEVLYQASISPLRTGDSLDRAECNALAAALKRILKKAVAVEANSDRFPKGWLFHRRWNHPHSSSGYRDASLRFDRVGGRTTAWDPKRQS